MQAEGDSDISQPIERRISLTRRTVLLLVIGLLAFTSLVSRPISRQPDQALGAQESTASPTLPPPTATSTNTSTTTPLPVIRATAPALPTSIPFFQTPLSQGMVFLAIEEGGFSHLFAYQPVSLPFTRLTYGSWDDITPALSPDGRKLAFASNRDGQWDLYMLELSSGQVTRLTDTLEYDASPSWSPDGLYLAFESYQDNLEIVIQPLSGEGQPVSLSNHPAADFSPAWSPNGRKIAFISTRSGEREVWLADLDRLEDQRFTNLSQDSQSEEAFPDWSPDGRQLAWASQTGGLHQVAVWYGSGEPRPAGSGDWPLWSPDGGSLLTALAEPNRTLLTAYRAEGVLLDLPPLIVPGKVGGLDWGNSRLPDPLPEALSQAAGLQPETLWLPILTPVGGVPNGRQHLAPLEGVQAPFPELHDQVDESFSSLRERVAQAAGWDFLATLENAYVPLTAPLPPGMGQDWLYTGRAFAFSPLPVDAGWIAVVPEQFGSDTYWHIYLRARSQDGTQGRPLVSRPWDFGARTSGDLAFYEQGGRPVQDFPAGYWIDFTALAAAYGWDRLPALPAWHSAVSAARLNEFVLPGGLSWQEAMLELYPPEALLTPTAFLPPTMTPTRTPSWPRPTPAPP